MKQIFWLPNAVFAVLSVCSAVVTLTLPETMNKPLPITTQDVHTIFYPKHKEDISDKKNKEAIITVVNGHGGDAVQEEEMEGLNTEKQEPSEL